MSRRQKTSTVPVSLHRISGTVVDSADGKPVPFCSIALYDLDNKQVIGGMADDTGSFSLVVSQAGKYSLAISSVGYAAKKLLHISVQSQEIALGKIGLQATTRQLEEVVVTGQRELIEDKGDRLVYNAEKDISNMGASAADVLRKVPMLAVDLNGNVQLRGSSNFRIFLNGKPSAMMAHNPADALRQIPGSNIKSVEVITSPGARYDAEGTSGIINIVTLKKWEGFFGSAYGSVGNLYQSVGSSVSMQGKKLGVSVTAGGYQYRTAGSNELYRTNLLPETTTSLYQRSEYDNLGPGVNLGVNLDYDPDSTSRLNLWLSGWGGNSPNNSTLYSRQATADGAITQEVWQDIRLSDSYLIGEINMGYTKSFRKKQKTYRIHPFLRIRQPIDTPVARTGPGPELAILMQYNNTPGRNFYTTDQFSMDDVLLYSERSANLSHSSELTFQTDYTYPFDLGKAAKATLEAGTKAIVRDLGSEYTFEQVLDDTQNFIEVPDRSSQFDYKQQVLSGYLSLRLVRAKNWVLTSGARLEHTRIEGDFASTATTTSQRYQNLIPNLSLSRKFKDKHTVRVSYTQRITRPMVGLLNPFVNYSNPQNLTTGNPELDPELAHAGEVVYSFFVGKNVFLTSSLFHRQTNNAIEPVVRIAPDGVAISSPQNVARRMVSGLQVNTSIKSVKKMTIAGGATLQRFDTYSAALQQGNLGWTGSMTGNVSYGLNKGVMVQANGNYHTGRVVLQGRTTAWYGYGFSVRKNVLKGKGNVTLTTNTPFNRVVRQTNYRQGPSFDSYAYASSVTRSVMLSFYWQFGEYKYSSKQTRTISNDDKGDNPKK